MIKLSDMLTKIYLIALAVFIIPMGFFTVYSWSWLQSVGSPQATVDNFTYWSGISQPFLWVSSAVLLILANVILWKTRRSWTLWVTLGYFVIFIILRYFWLDQSLFQFKKTNLQFDGSFSIAPILGAVFCLLAAVIVFFNQFIVLRMSEKMHPNEPLPQPSIDEYSDDVIDKNDTVN
jgi:hypothetical protein